MKSRNLNLKHACGQCERACKKKRARLDREEAEHDGDEAVNFDDIENNKGLRLDEDDSSDNTDDKDDVAVIEASVKKIWRTSFTLPLPIVQVDFMGDDQPYRRFKAAQ